ncbi:MAG: DmsC/YnfH family molybdoenzyme membrane anchor subunit [Dokdonella sp.]
MRPTFSIILFTVLSGAGYGLLFLCGLGMAIDGLPANDSAPLLVGGLLVSVGLMASVGHLGKPMRAWRAFSQWRSSWLSREGIAALATYVPLVVLLSLWFPCRGNCVWLSLRIPACLLLAAGCVVTVFCTANIYACLKPIRAWNNAYTLPLYLLLGLYSGAMLLLTLDWPPVHSGAYDARMQWLWLATAIIIAPSCALLKWRYWQWLDTRAVTPDAGSATGLDRIGSVQSFEQPHTEENYLTHEMGFVLARKHSRRLRRIAFWLILLAPLAVFALGWLIGWPAAWLALALGMTGIFVERWLFFAEAKHAVMAYYGR